MVNLAIIDGDSICYLHKQSDTIQEAVEKVDNKIQEILAETKADYYVVLLSKGRYYRHDISTSKEQPKGSYKSKRVYGVQPWVQAIKEYLISKYKAVHYSKLEADDICMWLMHKTLWHYATDFKEDGGIQKYVVAEQVYLNWKEDVDTTWEEVNKILVAKDKDLLYSIPSKGKGHLNFSCKLDKDTWGMKWVETSIEDSHKFYHEQLLAGDASDGIEALKGVGPKRAEKLMDGWKEGHAECHILGLYIEYYKNDVGKAIYEFQKNWRLLHMLTTDEDYLREVGYIPSLPEFQKVNKPEEINVDF